MDVVVDGAKVASGIGRGEVAAAEDMSGDGMDMSGGTRGARLGFDLRGKFGGEHIF